MRWIVGCRVALEPEERQDFQEVEMALDAISLMRGRLGKAGEPPPYLELDKTEVRLISRYREFERKFHLADDKANVECPFCHSRHIHRIYSAPFVIFKGPGFYINDRHSDE